MADAPASDTKVCPFCAEEIKAAAVVCRYCGREQPVAAKAVPAAPPLKKPARQRPAGALVVLLGVCVLCGLVMQLAEDEEQPAQPAAQAVATEPAAQAVIVADPTASPRPSPTTRPTRTPRPTATRRPATATPVPEPTATPDPALQAEEEYRAFVQAVSNQYQQGLNRFVEQSSEAGENPLVMFDENWRVRTAVALSLIQDASGQIRDRENVPERFQNFHSQFVEVARLMDESMTVFAEGIDEADATKLTRSGELMVEATTLMNQLPVDEVMP